MGSIICWLVVWLPSILFSQKSWECKIIPIDEVIFLSWWVPSFAGWWFGCHQFYFPRNLGNVIIPIDEVIFLSWWVPSFAGWWFGCHQFYFPRNLGNVIIPIDEVIFLSWWVPSFAGWWFGCHQFYFPRNLGNVIIPIDEVIFLSWWVPSFVGWWFGCHQFYFPRNLGNVIIPIDEVIFLSWWVPSFAGWWFGTSILFSQKSWECHHPNWRSHIFIMMGSIICWLVVWLPSILFSQKSWECHHPNRRNHIFIMMGSIICWLVVTGCHPFYFPRNLGNVIIPIDEVIFLSWWVPSFAGWWFGCHQFYFPRNLGNVIIPIDEVIFLSWWVPSFAGWWFGCHQFYFPRNLGNVKSSRYWRSHIFIMMGSIICWLVVWLPSILFSQKSWECKIIPLLTKSYFYHDGFHHLLVGGLVAINFIFPEILGMSSSQLTKSYFYHDGFHHLLVGGLEHQFYFPRNLGNVIIPIDEVIFLSWWVPSFAGWWFGTSILFSQKSWECHHPNWRTHIFQRGEETTNQPRFFREPWLKHQPLWLIGVYDFFINPTVNLKFCKPQPQRIPSEKPHWNANLGLINVFNQTHSIYWEKARLTFFNRCWNHQPDKLILVYHPWRMIITWWYMDIYSLLLVMCDIYIYSPNWQ